MTHQYKWFWITFCGWCFTAAVGAWALIFSPFHLNSKKISEFSSEVNGTVGINQILVCASPLPESLRATTQQWQSEGWKCTTGTLNLAPLLLKSSKENWAGLDSLAQLRIFQKGDSYRLLGLLSDFNDNQTYEWIAEVPKKALKSLKPSEVDFPLKPPSTALDIRTVKSKKIETCMWSLRSPKKPDAQFMDTYASQGFSGRLWSKQNRESIYILRRGTLRLLAVVEAGNKKSSISVVKLDKI